MKENILAWAVFGGNSNYKDNGAGWLLLSSIEAVRKENKAERLTSRQLKGLRASLVAGKEPFITCGGRAKKAEDQTDLNHQCSQDPKKVKPLTKLDLLRQGQDYGWERMRPDT